MSPFGKRAVHFAKNPLANLGFRLVREDKPPSSARGGDPWMATGLGVTGLLGWRRKRKNAAANAAA